MATLRLKSIAIISGLLVLGAGYGLYRATAQVVPPVLAQAPLNMEVTIPPAFIMAVDNSGSMSFHNQFPGADGYARWSGSSFFTSPGVLRETGGTTYAYGYTGIRIGDAYRGIPPVDQFGFARSSDFNPAYFNPQITYQPWVNSAGVAYANAALPNTRNDPRNTDTINLASWLADKQERSRFQAWRSMFLPAGVEYRVINATGNSDNNDRECGGLSNNNSSNWQVIPAGGHTMPNSAAGECALYIKYWPATFYLRETVANTAPVITASGYAGITPVRIANSCGAGCHLWRYTISSSDTVALQNFANWYSFYGNRMRAMIAGMTISMANVENMRVGYFHISQHGSRDEPLTKTAERVTMYDMGVPASRGALYSQMLSLNASSSTYNRQSVYALGQQFMRDDAGAPIQLVCQKNAGMLFTDGFSNGGTATVGNTDGTMGTPFQDGHSDTMADIATRYYMDNAGQSPLRPDLTAGRVPVPAACPSSDPKVNCQANLHMSFYGITLGGRGNLFDPNIVQDPFTDSSIYSNWPAWQNDNRSTVDDIWHATVNTRGEFISARTPNDIAAAMRRILASVSEGSTPSGTLSMTGARIGDGSFSVRPDYASANNGTDWYGRLTAETVTASPTTGEAGFTTAWEASNELASQTPALRNIRFGRTAASVTPTVQLFNAGNVGNLSALCNGPLSRCDAAKIAALNTTPVTLAQAVSYLRGDRTLETAGILRERTTLLGDIVNSTPVVSSPKDDYGYQTLGGTLGSSYTTYLTGKPNRPLVLVGANDGMLHIFDGRTDSNGGDELFAYIPATALGHMGNLLFPYKTDDGDDQVFQHRYYVDGPVTVSDVNIGGTWKTVAVATSGAGGRSVFALDITDPDNVSVLWEVNDLITGNPNIADRIGHVLGKPIIVPVKDLANNISWKAIFGNGYNSDAQEAWLFVVDIGTGDVSMISASESPALPFNGLGNVLAVDRKIVTGGTTSDGRDGFADTLYAADQNGAVWKFDLINNAVALGGQPLFVAQDSGGNRQPIMGGLTAAAGPSGAVMIYFGTGSFSFTGDENNTSQQSLYGILDRGTAVTRGQLLQQTVGSTTGDFRQTSSNSITSAHAGWHLDLSSGERFVGYPRVENAVVFMPTYDPSSGGVVGCSVTGNNWLYGLHALSGSAALSQVKMGSPTGPSPASTAGAVALATGGTAPVRDVGVMTAPRLQPLGPGATQPEIDAALAAQCSMVVRVAGAPPMYLPRPCGRQSWRQVR